MKCSLTIKTFIVFLSERARIALGYEAEYRNDYHICETFDDFMCDNFFDELAFLADGASEEAPTEFDQIVFQPTIFPEDDPLQFTPLPKGEKMKIMSPSNKAHLSALKWSKFSLQIIKDESKDYMKKSMKTTEIQCDLIPEIPMSPGNPAYWACKTIQLAFSWIWFAAYVAIRLA